MFQVKICGITSVEDARAVAEAGADAIGLNFYEPSPRYVDMKQAECILATLPDRVVKVGVFVNSSVQKVIHTFDKLRLDVIQLHGDEPPPMLGLLGGRPVVRAFRCRESGLEPVTDYLAKCRDLGCLPDAVLLDAYYPGRYGGTGHLVDWDMIGPSRGQFGDTKLVLAGGLNAANVRQAIVTVRPLAVDIASGVEFGPGVKDHEQVRAFVAAAKAAFDHERGST